MFTTLSMVFAVALIASPLHAQLMPPPSAEYTYNPEDRFAVPARVLNNYDAVGAKIEQIQAGDLPDFIVVQATLMAQTCTQPASGLADMKFYRYTSDESRRIGTANYMIDLNGLADKTQRQCLLGRACTDAGECYLVGFEAYEPRRWERNFMIRQSKWAKAVEADAVTRAPLTLINVTSRLLCREVAANGENTFDAVEADDGETCTLPYLWLNTGLIQHKSPSEADLANSRPPQADASDEE